MHIWRISAVLALAGGLAACAYPNPAHVAALNGMVGHTEQEVVQAYGVPSRVYDVAGHHYMAYARSRITSTPGTPGFGPYWGGPYWGGWRGWGYGGWGGFPPEIEQRDCETTFDLVNHIVKTWTLRGNAC